MASKNLGQILSEWRGNGLIKDRHLTRLIRAYPSQAEAQLHRVPPAEGASTVEAVLARFHDATAAPMGKAIALAVMLDQDERGETRLDAPTREKAMHFLEETFKKLAND